MPKAEPEVLAKGEQTAFTVTDTGEEIRLSWGDDPLDFFIHSYAQAADLANKLRKALGII